jgi:hypothetical protein
MDEARISAAPNLTLGEVGGQMREEWRAEQESAAADAASQWRHSRKLTDWLTERMHAGDRVAIISGAQRFTGAVEETSDDLVALLGMFGRVDIHVAPGLPLSISLEEAAHEGGQRAKSSRSFHDVLLERDGRDDLSVGTSQEHEGLDGTLHVGADFVSVITRMGFETVVPLAFVTWVAPRRM